MPASRHLGLAWIAAAFVFMFGATPAYAQCPRIGYSADCSIIIEIRPSGALVFHANPAVPPYDNIEDTLVGVVNHSGATVFGISLTGNDILGFDGDGAGDPTGSFWAAGSPYGAFPGGPFGPYGYEGPGISFSIQDASTGTVNFDNGLNNNGFIWFSLEGSPTQVRLSQRVTVDPGHGANCAAVNQAVGAIGETDYPATNPPAGKLREDVLAVAIAASLNTLLTANGFDVQMTKTDSVTCPTFLERTTKANKAKSNIFVSVHLNAPRFNVFGIGSGTLVIYNSSKSSSQQLAALMAPSIASSIGLNNRGTRADNTLAVLKATTSRMTAVLTEVGRLSAPDEDVLHAPATAALAAGGIAGGIDAFLIQ